MHSRHEDCGIVKEKIGIDKLRKKVSSMPIVNDYTHFQTTRLLLFFLLYTLAFIGKMKYLCNAC